MRKCQGNPHFPESVKTLVFVNFSGFLKNLVKNPAYFDDFLP